MKEQILKILRKCNYPDGEQDDDVMCAKEITDHVFKFIKWIQDDCPFWYEMNNHYWQDMGMGKRYTIKGLYQYWLTNIKNVANGDK